MDTLNATIKDVWLGIPRTYKRIGVQSRRIIGRNSRYQALPAVIQGDETLPLSAMCN